MQKHTKRNTVLLLLLAVLCVGVVELAACRHFEPELYQQITAPVRYAAAVTADACQAGARAAGQFFREAGAAIARFAGETMDSAAQLWDDLTAPKPTVPPEESQEVGQQEASEPTLSRPPASDPPLTELVEIDGRQVLTGGALEVTYFYQAGEEWADKPYGTDTIGPYGCGPTVMAMAVASLTDTDTDPAVMSAWAVDHGYWARRSGSYHGIVIGTAQAFGIQAEAFPSRDAQDMRRALREGKILVALVGPGHFTSGGHFIMVRGVTLTGDVLVADPNSPERSLEAWDPQIILDELSSARDHGAPLWVLSKPQTQQADP